MILSLDQIIEQACSTS